MFMAKNRQYPVMGSQEMIEVVLNLRTCKTFSLPCLTHKVAPLVFPSQATLSRVLGSEGALSFESEDSVIWKQVFQSFEPEFLHL